MSWPQFSLTVHKQSLDYTFKARVGHSLTTKNQLIHVHLRMPEPHERDIQSIASTTADTQVVTCYTELSYAIATSLAFAKRITWEQTPWLNLKLDANDAYRIADYMQAHKISRVSPGAVTNALLFGETYHDGSHSKPLGVYPQIFVIFPYLKHDVSTNETFLELWHNEIVRPAFNRAWEDSGLIKIYGQTPDFKAQFPVGIEGPTHEMHAVDAQGIIHHLRSGSKHAVHAQWPSWKDFWGPGHEGKFSDTRARIFDYAWKSIVGAVNSYPGMEEFHHPQLLVINRASTELSPDMTVSRMYEMVGQQWDRFVDSRYVVPGSFKVVIKNVIGSPEPVRDDLYDDDNDDDGTTNVGKRKAWDNEEGSHHHDKRGRVSS